jgi:hypothetical protein
MRSQPSANFGSRILNKTPFIVGDGLRRDRMSSAAINTVIKMMESLSEDKQDKIVEHLREYIQDLQDEEK